MWWQLVHIFLSAIVGGVWISFLTRFTEKQWTKLWGVIWTLPSTLLVILLFVWMSQWVDIAAAGAFNVVYGLIADITFLFFFILTARRGVTMSLSIWLLAWFGSALLVAQLQWLPLLNWVIIYVLVTVLYMLLLETYLHIPEHTWQQLKYWSREMTIRWIVWGLIVWSVVGISYILPPIRVGIVSMFPAMFITSTYIFSTRQSFQFAQSASKIFILWVSNLLPYSLVVAWLYPLYWLTWWTFWACLVSVVWARWLKQWIVPRVK